MDPKRVLERHNDRKLHALYFFNFKISGKFSSLSSHNLQTS